MESERKKLFHETFSLVPLSREAHVLLNHSRFINEEIFEAILEEKELVSHLNRMDIPKLSKLITELEKVAMHLRNQNGNIDTRKIITIMCQIVQAQDTGQNYPITTNHDWDGKNGATRKQKNNGRNSHDEVTDNVKQMLKDVFQVETIWTKITKDGQLMQLIAKVPEDQTLMALTWFKRDMEQFGLSYFRNPNGYLIKLLKKAQTESRKHATKDLESTPFKVSKEFNNLKPKVQVELQEFLKCRYDRTMLEDAGLMKQLGRLSEENGLKAIENYKDAMKRKGNGEPILNPSAYFMVILREFLQVSNVKNQKKKTHRNTHSSSWSHFQPDSSMYPESLQRLNFQPFTYSHLSHSPSPVFNESINNDETGFLRNIDNIRPVNHLLISGFKETGAIHSRSPLSQEPFSFDRISVAHSLSSPMLNMAELSMGNHQLHEFDMAIERDVNINVDNSFYRGSYPPNNGIPKRQSSNFSNWNSDSQRYMPENAKKRSDIDEMTVFLKNMNLGKYANAFQEAGINMQILSQLDDKDLETIGVKKGPRLKILNAVHRVDLTDSERHSYCDFSSYSDNSRDTNNFDSSLNYGNLNLQNRKNLLDIKSGWRNDDIPRENDFYEKNSKELNTLEFDH